MKKLLIVGGGALGSRHLQGLLRLGQPSMVYVVDPSESSLSLCKERAKEISHSHQIFFQKDLKTLPDTIDLCIVATNSDVRLNVIKELVNTVKIDQLILEKVLFQKHSDYQEATELINANKLRVWVNHPMRTYPVFRDLATKLQQDRDTIQFRVYGKNWGLGCNSLHYIDLVEFLRSTKIVSADTHLLRSMVESKRKGFREFLGTITVFFENGDTLHLTDSYNEDGLTQKDFFSIHRTNESLIFKKTQGYDCLKIELNSDIKTETLLYDRPMQGELTKELSQSLIDINQCNLPSFEQASLTHQAFIAALLKFMQTQNIYTETCPIT